MTLYTVPLYKVRAHNYIVSDTILTDGRAQNWARTADQIVLYWFPSLKEVIVANLTFVPADTPGTAFSSILPASTGFFNLIIKKTKETVYSITSSECAAASALGKSCVINVTLFWCGRQSISFLFVTLRRRGNPV